MRVKSTQPTANEMQISSMKDPGNGRVPFTKDAKCDQNKTNCPRIS